MKIVVIGNPVMSSAETVKAIKEYDTVEQAEQEIADSILEPIETINGCWYSFKQNTPYRNINRYWSGKLKQHCYGEGWGGWEIHGGQCSCGKEPDKYSSFDSPRYLIVEN